MRHFIAAAGRGLLGPVATILWAAGLVLAPGRLARASVEELAGPYRAELIEAIDGDTLAVRVRIWLGQEVTTHVRVAGVDTPELRGRCPEERARAEAARAALARIAAAGPLTLSDVRFDKYGGRIVARVTDATGADIATELVAAGLGRAYDGGAREAWCG